MEAAKGWISDLTFPTTKLDLIDAAEDAGAPNELLERLQQLGQEQYESRQELEEELDG